MTYYPEFSRLLNRELQRQDRSASWLAQRLDVSPSTVARWLNHDTRPSTATIVTQIAAALGITARKHDLLVAAGFSQPLPLDAAVSAASLAAPSPSPEAAKAWADADPYIAAGVYAKVIVKPFKKVLPA